MLEKRNQGRWSINGRAAYRKLGEPGERNCASRDISASGIRITTTEHLQPDTALDLQIVLAEDLKPVHARGRVIWQAPDVTSPPGYYNTGVHFDTIYDTDRDEIFKYAYLYKREEITNRWWQGL